MYIIEQIRKLLQSLARRIARYLDRITKGMITPNSVTMFGFLMHLPIVWLIVQHEFVWAAVFLLVFGLFDTLDGELARTQKRTTNSGMFLDSVTDRFKEIMIYLAILWVTHGKIDRMIIVSALAISLCVTYINAWGEVVLAKSEIKNKMTNKLLRTGIASYDIRMFLLFIGLLVDKINLAITVILVLGLWTVFVRMQTVFTQLKKGKD